MQEYYWQGFRDKMAQESGDAISRGARAGLLGGVIGGGGALGARAGGIGIARNILGNFEDGAAGWTFADAAERAPYLKKMRLADKLVAVGKRPGKVALGVGTVAALLALARKSREKKAAQEEPEKEAFEKQGARGVYLKKLLQAAGRGSMKPDRGVRSIERALSRVDKPSLVLNARQRYDIAAPGIFKKEIMSRPTSKGVASLRYSAPDVRDPGTKAIAEIRALRPYIPMRDRAAEAPWRKYLRETYLGPEGELARPVKDPLSDRLSDNVRTMLFKYLKP